MKLNKKNNILQFLLLFAYSCKLLFEYSFSEIEELYEKYY